MFYDKRGEIMNSPACESPRKIMNGISDGVNGEKKIIKVIDRETAAAFIADFLLDRTKELRPEQYREFISDSEIGIRNSNDETTNSPRSTQRAQR